MPRCHPYTLHTLVIEPLQNIRRDVRPSSIPALIIKPPLTSLFFFSGKLEGRWRIPGFLHIKIRRKFVFRLNINLSVNNLVSPIIPDPKSMIAATRHLDAEARRMQEADLAAKSLLS